VYVIEFKAYGQLLFFMNNGKKRWLFL